MSVSNMNILIIGGSQFAGLEAVKLLAKRGHRLTVFNRGRHVISYPSGVRHIEGDRNLGFGKMGEFDTVIDMCSYKGEQTNIALKDLKFDFFLHMSTAAVYRKSEKFPLTEESPVGDWPLWGGYNKGKVECERVLERNGARYAAIRPVYILGPRNPLPREIFIYSSLVKRIPLILPGDGQALVQFVSVRDVAKSMVAIAENKMEGIFNCAGPDVITLEGLVEEMGKIAGREPRIKFNSSADGERFNEKEFPFANENFFCSAQKLTSKGIVFTPLLEFLGEDYENWYKNEI